MANKHSNRSCCISGNGLWLSVYLFQRSTSFLIPLTHSLLAGCYAVLASLHSMILAHFRCNFVSADSLVAADTQIDTLRDLIQNAHHQHSCSVLSFFALICAFVPNVLRVPAVVAIWTVSRSKISQSD